MKKLFFKLQSHIRTLWYVSSIKMKISLFFLSIFITAIGLIYFCFYQSNTYFNHSNIYLESYYNTNDFINSLETANKVLELYMRTNNSEYLSFYTNYKNHLDTQVSYFVTNKELVTTEQHLLIRAIRNSYESYSEKVNILLNNEQSNKLFVHYYTEIIPTSEYVLLYAKQLLNTTLYEGQLFYAKTRHKVELMKVAITLFIFTFLCFSISFAIVLERHIIIPILRLSKASMEISEERFDGPDVTCPNNDEIYQLTKAFNQMKHSMHHIIDTLKEKNEMATKLHQEELKSIQMQKSLEEARISQLQSQINPHFLFNTLNTISRMARIEGAQKTEVLITKLAKLFRYTLQTCNAMIPLAREIAVIEDYIHIQQIRFGERVKMDWQIDEMVKTEEILVPSFTLQPLIENSIIHGLEPKIQGGIIRVRMHYYEGVLIIFIMDNGVGVEKEKLSTLFNKTPSTKGHISGIGLGNVANRLKLFYPSSTFSVRSKKGIGTSIIIKIPLTKGA